jgi:HlyD family secretion protein
MTPKTRWSIAAVALATAALLGWALAPRPLPVEVAEARAGPFELAIVEDGRTRLRERHVVSAPLAGRLQRITLSEGDAVAAGTVVAVLSPLPAPMLDARSQAELQARRAAAEAALERAGAMVGQQQVALTQAQTDLKRSEQLAQQAFIAPTKLEADRLAVQAARQGLEAAQQGRHVAAHELQVAQAALLAQRGGPDGRQQPFVLRAPVAGQVLKVLQTSEGVVATGTPLVELGDTAALEVVAELLTTEAVRVPAGAPVRIERWGGPGTLAGRVRRVEPGGFTKVSALGVEEQRVRVLVDLMARADADTAWRRLGDGYRVGVRIVTLAQDAALQVPVSAVFPRPGTPGAMALFRLEGGRARLTPVTLGGRNSEQAWVQDGLKAGDTVIVYPPAALADGARVRRREPASR